MGSCVIGWTAGAARELNFADVTSATPPFEEFRGEPVRIGATQISHSGQAVSVVHSQVTVYAVKFIPLKLPGTDLDFYARLWQFVAHAKAGGEFSFAVDSAKDSSTTLSAQAAAGATSLSLTSTAGMSVGDVLYIEHLTDKSKWEKNVINAIPGAVTLEQAVVETYPASSIVRHHEYFPTCVIGDPYGMLLEKQAGQGANRYDFAFSFTAVR
jgi:hypothetical protein